MYDDIIKRWEARGYDALFAENAEAARKMITAVVPSGATISLGGSVTLDQIGVVELLRDDRYRLIDRYAELTAEERTECFKKGLTADWLVTGTNAVTKEGELVNIDGNGNRVAPLIYGAENVLVVFGKNKIVNSIDDGIARAQRIAPINAKRLNRNTPCVHDGICHDCQCADRICNATTIIHNSYRFPKRIKLLLVDEDLGY